MLSPTISFSIHGLLYFHPLHLLSQLILSSLYSFILTPPCQSLHISSFSPILTFCPRPLLFFPLSPSHPMLFFVSLLVSVHPLVFSPLSSFRSPFITSPPSFYLYTLIFSSLPLPLFRPRPSFLTHSFSLNPETSPSFPTRVLPTPPSLLTLVLFPSSHSLLTICLPTLKCNGTAHLKLSVF